MKTGKFFLQDIRQNPSAFLIVTLQVTVALILLCYSFSMMLEGRDAMEKLGEIEDSGPVYKLTEHLEAEEIDELVRDGKSGRALFELKQYMENIPEFTCVTSKNSSDFIFDMEKSELDPRNAGKFLDSRNGRMTARMLEVNENFFGFYGIEGCYELGGSTDKDSAGGANRGGIADNTGVTGDGRDSSTGIAGSAGAEAAPKAIILGHSFRECCGVEDILCDFTGERYRVTGFLPEGAYYVNPYEQWEPFYLDEYVIVRAQTREEDAVGTFIDLMSTMIVSEDGDAVEALPEKAAALGIGVFDVENYSARVESKAGDIVNSVMTLMFLAAVILLFCSIGFLVNMLRFIDSHMEEFAVHMLCGAGKGDIIRRICLQTGSIVAAGLMISFAAGRMMDFSARDGQIPFLLTAVTAVLYAFVILLYPVRILKKQNICDIIRRK